MDDEQVTIEVEAGECGECDGRVWDVYRTEGELGHEADRDKIGTHGKKPAAKKAARELAEADQANGARVSLRYPEGARTMTEDYAPPEQAELPPAAEDTHGPDTEAEAEPFA